MKLTFHEDKYKNYNEIVEEIEEKIENIQRMIDYMHEQSEKEE